MRFWWFSYHYALFTNKLTLKSIDQKSCNYRKCRGQFSLVSVKKLSMHLARLFRKLYVLWEMKINLLEGGAKKKKSFQRKSSSIFKSFLAFRVNERVIWREGFIRFSWLFISWLIKTLTFVVKVADGMILSYFHVVWTMNLYIFSM